MPPPNKKNIPLSVAEIAKVLCPECTKKLKQLIAEKMAEHVMLE